MYDGVAHSLAWTYARPLVYLLGHFNASLERELAAFLVAPNSSQPQRLDILIGRH